jgi:SET family sugar efflux transporter-like MFS transporter
MPSRLRPVTILAATIFLIGLSSSAINPYRGIVAIDGLKMSNSAFALVSFFSSLGTAIVSLMLGHFADRVADRRLGVMICAAFAAFAYALIFLAPSQLSYVVAFCVVLPFGGALFSQTFSFSRAYLDRENIKHSEFMMSVLRTLFSLSWVVAPAVVGWVASHFSVFAVFGAAAASQVMLLLVFGSLFLRNDTKVGAAQALSLDLEGGKRLPEGRIIGIVGVTLLRVAIFLHLMTVPLVITHNFHGSLTDVSLNAAICAGLEIPFMIGWGYAAARFGKEFVIIASAVVYAIYLCLICFAHSVQDVLWLQGVNAIGTAALVSIPISYMQESIRGRVGLSTALFDTITVIASTVAAGIFVAFSTRENYIPVMLAAAIVTLLGAGAIISSKIAINRSKSLARGSATTRHSSR